jgi:hypothetical protein
LDIVVVNLEELEIKMARNAVPAGSCGCSSVCFLCAAPGAVGVLVFSSDVLGVGFSILNA